MCHTVSAVTPAPRPERARGRAPPALALPIPCRDGSGERRERGREMAVDVGVVAIASLVLMVSVVVTLFALGSHHAFGGRRIKCTASWFESLGLRQGRLYAMMATATEFGACLLLLLGLLTPLAAAGAVGT